MTEQYGPDKVKIRIGGRTLEPIDDSIKHARVEPAPAIDEVIEAFEARKVIRIELSVKHSDHLSNRISLTVRLAKMNDRFMYIFKSKYLGNDQQVSTDVLPYTYEWLHNKLEPKLQNIYVEESFYSVDLNLEED